MDIRINQLKLNFTHIIDIRAQVISIFDILQQRIDKLKLLYADFIKSNRDNLFIFGLDSFHFQSKILDIEYDDMKRLFLAINNRIYCEYFKLYNIIVSYVCETIKDKKALEMFSINNSFPVYKDLEPFKQYKFEIIQEIHENILLLLSSTNNYIINKEHELKLHQGKQEIGLNIDNFVNTFNYNVSTIRDKTLLFITYVEFFHKLHTKYLRRFATKVQTMYSQINSDITFDENASNKNQSTMISSPVVEKPSLKSRFQQGVKNVINGLAATNIIKEIEKEKEVKMDNNQDNIQVVLTNSFKEESNVLMEIIEANKPIVVEEKPIEMLMDEIVKKCDEISETSLSISNSVSNSISVSNSVSNSVININNDDNIDNIIDDNHTNSIDALEEAHIKDDEISLLTQETEVELELDEPKVEEKKKRGRPKKNK